MNQFSSPNGRPLISELKRSRESKINSLINNLKLNDLKDDNSFETTAAIIKREILFTPVVIGDPKLLDYEFKEMPFTFQQQLMGGSRNHYVHTISFPYTGDTELFSYSPEQGFSFSASDHGLIIPYGREINVDVDLPELNPEQAISQARQLIRMTLQFANSNNETIKSWNVIIGQRIDEMLKTKKEELIRIFGGAH